MSLQNLLKHSVDVKIIDDYLQTLAQKQIELNHTNAELNRHLNSVKNSLLKSEEENKKLEKEKTDLSELVKNRDKEFEELKKPPISKVSETRIAQFIVRDNGTALDTKTGLTWCRYSVGQIWNNRKVMGTPQVMTWEDSTSTQSF